MPTRGGMVRVLLLVIFPSYDIIVMLVYKTNIRFINSRERLFPSCSQGKELTMIRTTTLGYPRIGRNRELKQACEAYWSGKIGEEDLHRTGAMLRRAHWQVQRDAGIDLIPVNDFSFYDQVLDSIALPGAVPKPCRWGRRLGDLDAYFAVAPCVPRVALSATAIPT